MATLIKEGRKKIKGLTTKRAAFVQAIMADPDMNQTQAARVAGYKNPSVAGSLLMRDKKIQKLMSEEQHKRELRTTIKSDEIWRYLYNVLYFDPVQVFRSAGKGWWWIKDLDEIPPEIRQMITRVETDSMDVRTADGQIKTLPKIKVQFCSKDKALEVAARHALPQDHTVNLNLQQLDWHGAMKVREDGDDPVEAKIMSVRETKQ